MLVSGAARPDSLPGLLVLAFLNGQFDLVTSEFQISEFKRVSKYPRIKKLLKPTRAGLLVNALLESALIFRPKERVDVSTDDDDNVIIAVALVGDADFLVSGDVQHMLVLKKIGRMRIVTVEEAVRLLSL